MFLKNSPLNEHNAEGQLKVYCSISVPLYQWVLTASQLERPIMFFREISRRKEGACHASGAVTAVPSLYLLPSNGVHRHPDSSRGVKA